MSQVGNLAVHALETGGQIPTRSARHAWLAAASLCKRELVRFIRQKHRVIGAIVPPIFFWIIIGAGMGRSFRVEHLPGGALQYFFPGTLLMILLFTAIFSTISIIEDRREGFLQSVLVAPIPRQSIVLGKVLGGTILAFGEALLLVPLAPFIGIHLTALGFFLVCGMLLVLAFGMTALSFCIAWRMTSTQGFHAIMNMFLMPLWFLSGALFPAENAWPIMRWLVRLNPLSYGLDGIRRALYFGRNEELSALPGCGVILVVSVGSALVMFLLASKVASAPTAADLAQ